MLLFFTGIILECGIARLLGASNKCLRESSISILPSYLPLNNYQMAEWLSLSICKSSCTFVPSYTFVRYRKAVFVKYSENNILLKHFLQILACQNCEIKDAKLSMNKVVPVVILYFTNRHTNEQSRGK